MVLVGWITYVVSRVLDVWRIENESGGIGHEVCFIQGAVAGNYYARTFRKWERINFDDPKILSVNGDRGERYYLASPKGEKRSGQRVEDRGSPISSPPFPPKDH